MNSKVIVKNSLHGVFIMNRNEFDYQLIRVLDCPDEQPDLNKMVRLFFRMIPDRTGFFLNVKKYFAVLRICKDEILLGSNQNGYELRLSFMKSEELPGKIILCFALSYLGLGGYIQSLYIRLIFRFMLPVTLDSLKMRGKKALPDT